MPDDPKPQIRSSAKIGQFPIRSSAPRRCDTSSLMRRDTCRNLCSGIVPPRMMAWGPCPSCHVLQRTAAPPRRFAPPPGGRGGVSVSRLSPRPPSRLRSRAGPPPRHPWRPAPSPVRRHPWLQARGGPGVRSRLLPCPGRARGAPSPPSVAGPGVPLGGGRRGAAPRGPEWPADAGPRRWRIGTGPGRAPRSPGPAPRARGPWSGSSGKESAPAAHLSGCDAGLALDSRW